MFVVGQCEHFAIPVLNWYTNIQTLAIFAVHGHVLIMQYKQNFILVYQFKNVAQSDTPFYLPDFLTFYEGIGHCATSLFSCLLYNSLSSSAIPILSRYTDIQTVAQLSMLGHVLTKQ